MSLDVFPHDCVLRWTVTLICLAAIGLTFLAGRNGWLIYRARKRQA